MPKTRARLYMGEEHDKEAQAHLTKAIEFEEMAVKAEAPADRERYGEMARHERDFAIEALNEAKIASGSELKELQVTGNTQF
jgi:hypothetical protein